MTEKKPFIVTLTSTCTVTGCFEGNGCPYNTVWGMCQEGTCTAVVPARKIMDDPKMLTFKGRPDWCPGDLGLLPGGPNKESGPCSYLDPNGGCISNEAMKNCILCKLKVPVVTCDNLSTEMQMIVNLGMKASGVKKDD